MHVKALFLVLVQFLICGNLTGGVKVVTKSKSLACNDYTSDGVATMYLRADIMRMDLVDAGNNFGIIYQKSTQRMWVLHHNDKRYETITKEDLDKVHSKLSDLREQMEEQMKNLTDEQKEQMKNVMMQNNSALFAEIPKVQYLEKDSTKIIGGWNCTKYEYLEGEELKGIYWIASMEEINVPATDFQIVRDFSEFIKLHFDMFSLGASTSAITPQQDFDGFPIRSVIIENGKQCLLSTVESIQQQPLDNSLFQIPADYRKDENPLKAR